MELSEQAHFLFMRAPSPCYKKTPITFFASPLLNPHLPCHKTNTSLLLLDVSNDVLIGTNDVAQDLWNTVSEYFILSQSLKQLSLCLRMLTAEKAAWIWMMMTCHHSCPARHLIHPMIQLVWFSKLLVCTVVAPISSISLTLPSSPILKPLHLL